MTKPISDERLADLVDMLGIDTDFDEHGFSIKRGTLRAVFVRIEALTAERDAAVAALQTQARCSRALGITEGERRATAAIVDWLRGTTSPADKGGYILPLTYERDPELAARYERGDHLTQL